MPNDGECPERGNNPARPDGAAAHIGAPAGPVPEALASRRGAIVLETASLLYIFIPTALWLWGWLRPAAAWPLLLVLAAGIGQCWWLGVRPWFNRDAEGGAPPASNPLFPPWSRWALVAGITGLFVAFTGIGDYSYRFTDFTWYDTLIRDFMESPWPPAWERPLNPGELVAGPYYFGFYLLPALAGKALGWAATFHVRYLYAWLGTLLAVVWFMRITGVRHPLWSLLFLFFGGLDLLGHFLTALPPSEGAVTWAQYLTGAYWWSVGRGWFDHWTANFALLTPAGREVMGGVFYRFYSPVSFLTDGPQHVLPLWVALLMILHDVFRRRDARRILFLSVSLPLCSVFVAVGTLPVLALGLWQTARRTWFSFANTVAGPVLVLVLLVFFAGGRGEIVQGWLWDFQNPLRTWPYLLLFYTAEFGLYALVCPPARNLPRHPGRAWLALCLAMFVVAPWYRMGEFNDFGTKVIIPAQLVFLVCLASALAPAPDAPRSVRRRRILLALLLVAGAAAPLGNLVRGLEFGLDLAPPPITQVRHAPEHLPQERFRQVRTDHDSFFWRHLAAPLHVVKTEPIPVTMEYDFTLLPPNSEGFHFFERETGWDCMGLRLRSTAGQPVVRMLDLDLMAPTVGTVELDHEVYLDGEPVRNHVVVFQWLNWEDQVLVEDAARKWLFDNWKSHVVHPLEFSVRANPYWRGRVTEGVLSFDVPDGPEGAVYDIVVRRITFLER